MSRIGKLPIKVPAGVSVEISADNLVKVKGPKGELSRQIHKNMIIEQKEDQITVSKPNEQKLNRSLHGLSRTLIANMVEGVSNGYKKGLEIIGVGYRANIGGKKLTLTLGFSHPIEYMLPDGIEVKAEEESKNKISVHGIDKELVGEVAAKIRSFRKPEPYKGKGIRYENEYVRRKAGKAAGSTSS